MTKALLALLAGVILVTLGASAVVATPATGAGNKGATEPVAIDYSQQLKHRKAPAKPTPAEITAAEAAGDTTASKCFGDDETLTITIPSFDAAHPGDQDVVFFKETAPEATGNATLWVAWDFLKTQAGRQDAITCDQIAYLQGQMDHIVASDKKYFGDYVERPSGNKNIDVMIYNIVDESSFDPNFGSYIAGFFWSSINDAFNRNMIFVDSYDWPNRLGADAARPYLYEGTVAHELQHLIHNDHDSDEDSWIDEGMADLAIYLAGYGHPDDHVTYYLAYHRTPLTHWGGGLPSYGASYLFQLYLLENFGQMEHGSVGCLPTLTNSAQCSWSPTWTRHEIDEQGNSIAGVEGATGANFNNLFDSWILANYLDAPSQRGAGNFPIGYKGIDLNPYTSPAFGAWSIKRAVTDIYGGNSHGQLPLPRYYPGGIKSGTVEYPVGTVPGYMAFYGTYAGIQPQLAFNIRGFSQSGVAPAAGSYEVSSGAQNMLTDRMLKLNVPVGGTLTFKTWYDIENEWDYGFVEASTDGGATWTPLSGDITKTSSNPNHSTAWANSLLGSATSTTAAITGSSNGWVTGTFTLPAASNVLVRFSYYTDEGTLGQGWFIDDVTATTAGGTFEPGFEAGSTGWNLGGWTRTTGLFNNAWRGAWINPIYANGKYQSTQWGYVDPTSTTWQSKPAQQLAGTVDTTNLGSDSATIVFANRPGENPFSTDYISLVSKGNNGG
jgi:Immune inhibitor A peptidase M6